jgi:hypothetical protein
MPNLESELAIAQSVILDECLEDHTKALTVVDAAIERFGRRPALIRQKSKVLRHQGLNDAAASLLIEIEDDIAHLAPFDQGLALRDGVWRLLTPNAMTMLCDCSAKRTPCSQQKGPLRLFALA